MSYHVISWHIMTYNVIWCHDAWGIIHLLVNLRLNDVRCDVCCMLYALCFMLCALCLMLYALCFMLYALCFMIDALCFMLYAVCFMLYVPCFMLYAFCLMLYALWDSWWLHFDRFLIDFWSFWGALCLGAAMSNRNKAPGANLVSNLGVKSLQDQIFDKFGSNLGANLGSQNFTLC